MARSTTLRSSRTLPGQLWSCRARTAVGPSRGAAVPVSARRVMKSHVFFALAQGRGVRV